MGSTYQASAYRSRKPVTSSGRVGSASNDSEAQGEEAYDGTRQLARGSNGIPHVTGNTINSQRNSRTLLRARSGPPKPSAKFMNAGHNLDTKTGNVNTTEEDDVAKAIKLSLTDATTRCTRKTETQYDTDISKAKLLSLSNDHDEFSTFLNSESSYNVQDALHSLYDSVGAVAKVLEEKAHKFEEVTAGELADCVREWEGTIFRAVHMLEAAEDRRVQDIRMRLDFDKSIEEKHRKKLECTNRLWEAKMREKEREWESKMADQKRAYEDHIANQAINSLQSSQEQTQSQIVKSLPPSLPPTQVAATSPTRDIATPIIEHTPNAPNAKAEYEASVGFLKQMIERLCDENAALRSAQKTKDENTSVNIKKMKVMYEAQMRLLKNKVGKLAAANADLSRSKDGRAVRSEPPQRSGAVMSPGKRKLDNGSRSEGSPPKKTKNGLED